MSKESYAEVKQRIAAACRKCGRREEEITLIAVSKTKPVSEIMEVYDAGQRVFGENRVQEMCEKIPAMPEDIQWHLIGHLQQNKVKYLMPRTAMIHSVDSVRLAQTISKEAVKHGIVMPVLAEVNAAEEESKFGVTLQELEGFLKEISTLPGICVKGLMTVAPFVDDPEENRPVFRALRQISVDINNKNINNIYLSELSMGMTNDFEVAIEEGATMIRIGTAIFGSRTVR
ncbi:MAG: YggS family pyridoxal phosphate-dependent enzyme [Lachnospiraceae bacterium]|nr:YggS family pyridoxal phosphate-dependent enzyme [Parasporobacterium sp.]MBR3397761.1 YggS family pyridoxal phosphate-dependent enzyme [Lachnospiraceae bacterium]